MWINVNQDKRLIKTIVPSMHIRYKNGTYEQFRYGIVERVITSFEGVGTEVRVWAWWGYDIIEAEQKRRSPKWIGTTHPELQIDIMEYKIYYKDGGK